MKEDDSLDPEVRELLRTESEAMKVAERHLGFYSPFRQLPDEVEFRTIADYTRLLLGRGIAKHEVPGLLETDLSAACNALRSWTLNMPWLSSIQVAALIHVAMHVGLPTIKAMDGLWQALKAKRFDQAADEILMSNWPRLVGNEPEERRRVIDISNMLRSGVLRTDWAR